MFKIEKLSMYFILIIPSSLSNSKVLAEIPEQITSYMKSRGFKPKTAEKPADDKLPNDASVIQPTAPML